MNVAVGQLTKQRIIRLLDDLPPKSLSVVEQFVLFLARQVRRSEPVVFAESAAQEPDEQRAAYRYPTVGLPPETLHGLVGLMPPVAGDALADTEALYDDV